MKMQTFTIDIEMGPVFRASLDVLDLTKEVLDLIPEWHSVEREELTNRAKGLAEMMESQLKHSKNGSK